MISRRLALIALGGLTALRLGVAAVTPLSPDEAYYWVWSRALAPGYLDHPPMVALWIRAGTALAGDGPLGVRLLAPLAAALGSIALARAAERLVAQPGAGVFAAAALNATLAFGIGAVTMTPDTPLLFFWTLALAAMAEVAADGDARAWLGAGAAAGCALASKYTAVLIAPALLVWLFVARGQRAWLRRWEPYGAAVIAAVVFAPVLVWNAAHGWASFARQGGRTGDFRPERALQYVGELLGGQVGLATPLLALLFGVGAVAVLRRAREKRAGLLAATLAVPGLVFMEHALGDRVQANWPAILYPSAAVAAAALGGRWRAWRGPALALGFAATALVWVQGIAAPLPLPRAIDPMLMRLGGWTAFAHAVEAAARDGGAAYVVDDNYGHAAILARLLPPEFPVLGIDARWRLFDLPDGAPAMAGRPGLLVRSQRRADAPEAADWRAILPAGEVARGRGGIVAERYRLYRVVGGEAPATPVAVMPRPR